MPCISAGHNEQQEYRKVNAAKYIGTDQPMLTINGFSTTDQGKYLCVIKKGHLPEIVSNPANMALGKYHCQIEQSLGSDINFILPKSTPTAKTMRMEVIGL